MKTVLCLDLDNTLLHRQEQEYHAAVLQSLCAHLAGAAGESCLARLRRAIAALIHKSSPVQTLDAVFFDRFAHDTGLDPEQIEAAFYDFYQNEYHHLGRFTKPAPAAADFVEQVLERGWEIVIATNPIYPQIAVEERLRWAGLVHRIRDFKLITSIEHFHYTKPNPAFYAEILARLGWQEDTRVYMIGDSFEMDVQPAYRAGMRAFLVGQSAPPDVAQSDCSWGGFDDLLRWIDEDAGAPGEPLSRLPHGEVFASLRGSPAAIDALTRGIDTITWRRRPHEGEWSLVEIICHLRDADRCVNIPRFQSAIREENAFLTSIDTDSWVTSRNYREEDGPQAAMEMLAVRAELLELLENLPVGWMERTARHSIFGPTSLHELVDFIVTHDKIHVRQLLDTLAIVQSQPSADPRQHFSS